MSQYFVYKQTFLKEAEQLVHAGIIYEREDIFYLTYEELQEVVRSNTQDYQIISNRKEKYISRGC